MSNTVDETRSAFAHALKIWIQQDGVGTGFIEEQLKEYEVVTTELQLERAKVVIHEKDQALATLRMSPNICPYMSGQPFVDSAAVVKFIDDARAIKL